MSDEDIQFLKNYGLTTIIDLRSKSERKDHPDPQIEGVKNISLQSKSSIKTWMYI